MSFSHNTTREEMHKQSTPANSEVCTSADDSERMKLEKFFENNLAIQEDPPMSMVIQKSLFRPRLCDDGRKSINIKLGTVPYNAVELCFWMTDNGFKVHYSARDVMRSKDFQVSPTIKKVDTVAITTKELGFDSHGGPLLEVYRRAMEEGFLLCPAEIGPRLRKHSISPLMKQKYFIGMSPIKVRNKFYIFKLWNAGTEPWLETEEILLSAYISGTFIFIRE